MKEIESIDFIETLTNDKPVFILFWHSAEKGIASKIKKTIEDIQTDLPLLPAFEFIVDKNEKNLELADRLDLDIKDTPVLTVFKDGNFNRYKNQAFTKASILKFLGNKKIYEQPVTKKMKM